MRILLTISLALIVTVYSSMGQTGQYKSYQDYFDLIDQRLPAAQKLVNEFYNDAVKSNDPSLLMKAEYLKGRMAYTNSDSTGFKYLGSAERYATSLDSLNFLAFINVEKGFFYKNVLREYDLAREAFIQGDSLYSLTQNYTGQSRAKTGQSYLLMDEKNYAAAMKILLDIQKDFDKINNNEQTNLLNNLGHVYLQLGLYEAAISLFEKSYSLNSSDRLKAVLPLLNKASALIDSKRFNEAKKTLDEISGVDLLPAYQSYYLRLRADVLLSEGQVEDASVLYDKIMQYESPNFETILTAIGLAKTKLIKGDTTSAHSILRNIYTNTSKVSSGFTKVQLNPLIGLLGQTYRYVGNRDSATYLSKLYFQNQEDIQNQKVYSYYFLEEMQQRLDIQGEQLELEKELKAQSFRFYLVTALLMLLVIGLLGYQIRLRAKNNVLLNDKNIALRESNKQLQESNEKLKVTQSQLIRSEKKATLSLLNKGLAHEINNPLNYIKGGVYGLYQSIEYEDEKENVPRYRKIIEEGIDRVASIIAKLGYGNVEDSHSRHSINLMKMINDCIYALSENLSNQVAFSCDVTSKSITIIGDQESLYQVFLNVISNSIDAQPHGGLIEIGLKEVDQNAVITIQDWGIGMEESTITKLGDPFFTTKDPGKGTGLGLYIAYQCVEVHNGSIQFESTPGEGTKCVITIPVAS